MIRKVIEIDEEKCNGCGLCVPACHEGAIQIIDGKARLISDLFCDGLGACIGDCPEGAIKVIEREAEPYNEALVMESMLKKPRSVVVAHLKHLKDHNEIGYLNEAMDILKARGIEINLDNEPLRVVSACPGTLAREIKREEKPKLETSVRMPSELEQWPVQLHLVNPSASFFNNKELIIMSTCGPIVNANVHEDYIKGRSVIVACPKLDRTEPYIPKLTAIFAANNIPKVTIVRVQVPCCGGLSHIAVEAARQSGKQNLTIEEHTLAISGELIKQTIVFKN